MLLYKIRVTIVCMITWGCFTRSDPSINASCCYTYVQVTPSCVRQRLAVSPYSGCCYHSASSGGSCSACSSASSPCGNRRSWGPSGYQGNGPAEACSETSSQMDWWGGRDMRYHSTHIISYNNNNDKKTQKRCQDGTKERRRRGNKSFKNTRRTERSYTRGSQHATSQMQTEQSTFKWAMTLKTTLLCEMDAFSNDHPTRVIY